MLTGFELCLLSVDFKAIRSLQICLSSAIVIKDCLREVSGKNRKRLHNSEAIHLVFLLVHVVEKLKGVALLDDVLFKQLKVQTSVRNSYAEIKVARLSILGLFIVEQAFELFWSFEVGAKIRWRSC